MRCLPRGPSGQNPKAVGQPTTHSQAAYAAAAPFGANWPQPPCQGRKSIIISFLRPEIHGFWPPLPPGFILYAAHRLAARTFAPCQGGIAAGALIGKLSQDTAFFPTRASSPQLCRRRGRRRPQKAQVTQCQQLAGVWLAVGEKSPPVAVLRFASGRGEVKLLSLSCRYREPFAMAPLWWMAASAGFPLICMCLVCAPCLAARLSLWASRRYEISRRGGPLCDDVDDGAV